MTYWMISDGVSSSAMLRRAGERDVQPQAEELHYVLELTRAGTIQGGEWIMEPETALGGDDSKKAHPDFMWMAVAHRGWGEDGDDLGGTDDNPYLAYSKVRALIDCSNDATTCAPAGVPPLPVDPIWSCDPGYNGTNDGCDCGCGVADPDCAGGGCTTAGCGGAACQYCYDAAANTIPCP